MIRLQPTTTDIPENILAQAYDFGKLCLNSGQTKTHKALQGVGGIYMFESLAYPDSDLCEVKIISLSNASFACTPRKHAINDGYNESGQEQGSGQLNYPLEDFTNTTAILGCNDGDIELNRDAQLYGNIDWIGINTAGEGQPSDAPVLTWKGPIGRSIPFNNDIPIEGFTVPDISFNDEAAVKYTCFGPHIYSNGDVLETIPTTGDCEPKVLGAAYQKDVLICIVNNHYKDKIGFFEEVWVKSEEWELVYTRTPTVGRPTSIWAFNQSGTRATQVLSEYTIDVETKSVSISIETNTDILCAISETNTGKKTLFSGQTKLWSDYKGDERVFAVVNAKGGHQFNAESSSINASIKAPVYVQGIESEFVPLTIVGPNTYTPSAYSASGGNGKVVLEETGNHNCCNGLFQIKATDSCGNTATKSVTWYPSFEGMTGVTVGNQTTYFGSDAMDLEIPSVKGESFCDGGERWELDTFSCIYQYAGNPGPAFTIKNNNGTTLVIQKWFSYFSSWPDPPCNTESNTARSWVFKKVSGC